LSNNSSGKRGLGRCQAGACRLGNERPGPGQAQPLAQALSELGEYQTTHGLAEVLQRVLSPHG
jgi:hypothetical protein